jgi:hypothetical protein
MTLIDLLDALAVVIPQAKKTAPARTALKPLVSELPTGGGLPAEVLAPG